MACGGLNHRGACYVEGVESAGYIHIIAKKTLTLHDMGNKSTWITIVAVAVLMAGIAFAVTRLYGSGGGKRQTRPLLRSGKS